MPNITVKFHNTALPTFAAWRQRLTVQDPTLYDVMLESMRNWFQQNGGHPPGSEYRPEMRPPRYVARFSSDVWVHYVRKTTDRGRTLGVVIMRVAESPPG